MTDDPLYRRGAGSRAVSTAYTHELVRSALRGGANTILEVGCGTGELAATLRAGGLDVVAIDSDANAVDQARANGVDAQVVHWPASFDNKFDAVLFTRSLHHIEPLDEALGAAVACLHPGGRIVVEDFQAEGGSDRSTLWYRGVVKLLQAAGALREGADLEGLLAKVTPDDHDHNLHSSASIASALAQFGPVKSEDAAYYFRYLEPEFRLMVAVQQMLDHELAMIGSNSIGALGKRFVLTPRLGGRSERDAP